MSDRNTPHRAGQLFAVPIAQATEIFGGHLIAANAGGFAVPATATAAQVTLGVSDGWVDNSTGENGDADAIVRRGRAWLFANYGGDAVTQAQVGQDCFVVDSQTVAKTSNENARPIAGKVQAISADGVWVLI
ncbi:MULTISPECIES: hypothetical protein [Brenneria]|uniref:DUF2190 domain-containing protein n=1 Tax=Brenneria nigrifluens DSM 30175 = ATCC 13028 TaxID=1121120 RepID=A0A2U1USN7_9GAMM|nr:MULTISPECIES: hypothetical protein [Brenneria]EHD21548.1 hypothetical protein BrE312_2165 [Brenneria sp. EniD312]PWC24666.1 hypothetical protein DDT54_08235 [Brenneria nigrifluens DSM 30175 = ATCC 13028]QCR04669.1 hypothetical protein EH206_11090 [Brenneria nigrifluens DSM 30175 = ATCC 13028]